jgi:hypothetical protein
MAGLSDRNRRIHQAPWAQRLLGRTGGQDFLFLILGFCQPELEQVAASVQTPQLSGL